MKQVVNRNLAAIAVRLVDDAHMAWVAASAESAAALRGSDQARDRERSA